MRTIAIASLIFATNSSLAGLVHAASPQKPDQVQGRCSGDGDVFFPPNDKGEYACLKKDGSGIVCGGVTDELKKTCDTWSANGTLPARAPDKIRGAAKKKAADKAAADKAKADKAAADKAAGSKAATGSGGSVHDCAGVKLTCGAWAAKDKNTCRTCQQAQCKTENGKDVLAGNKTQTQCYEGHGAPPSDVKKE